jgi:TolA-binding protein
VKRLLVASASCLALAGAGCVTTASEGAELRADLEQLKSEVADSEKAAADRRADQDKQLARIEERAAALEDTLSGLRQGDADTGVQMEKVIAELQQLRGDVEEARYQLGETKKSVADILERPPVDVAMAEAAPALAEAPTIDGKPIPEDKQALYDLGKKLFDEKKLKESQRAFEAFAKRYPADADLTDNAWFWKGEAHYAEAAALKPGKAQEGAYKQAILSYQKVLALPKANKADGALFKIGLAFEALAYFSEAKVFYEEILAKHPKSPLLKEAKKRLRVVTKKSKKKGRR